MVFLLQFHIKYYYITKIITKGEKHLYYIFRASINIY